jgi:hypothetical protein
VGVFLMAIICYKHNILFIMVPGTASTTVGEFLIRDFGGEYFPKKDILVKHITLDQIVEGGYLTEEELPNYLKFTIVRNPFDYWVTDYVRLTGPWMQAHLKDPDSFINRLGEENNKIWRLRIQEAQNLGFEKWLRKTKGIDYLSRNPIKSRIKNSIKVALGLPPSTIEPVYPMLRGIDVVLQYERVEDDLHTLLRKIRLIKGEKKIKLAYMKQTPEKKDYHSYYSSSFRTLIERIYSKELALFGYKFNGIDNTMRITPHLYHKYNCPLPVNQFTQKEGH